MDRPPQTPPGQAGTQQPIRPPYLREEPWTSSTPPKDESHWTRVRQLLKKCDGDTIGAWQEEINTQLIVSALLSALTGAFVTETQKSLSEDPTVTTAVLLSHIAMQLNASSVLPPSTLQPFSNPPPNARAVNSLLYVSLGLSLSNVTLGLLCLQWLRDLKADPPGIDDKRYPMVHWVRHTGFQKWGAKGIVSTLPVLLLSSLTCFFAGLLCHVSTTDWVVSVPVGVVLGVTFTVLVLTTLVPVVVIAGYIGFHQGVLTGGYPLIPPFQSLQSWISLQLTLTILGSPIFKKLTTFPDRLRDLKQCPDWGRLSSHWAYHVASADPIILPFLHSAGNPSSFDDVTQCFFHIRNSEQFPDGNPVRMKIQTLCCFIGMYSKKLSLGAWKDLHNKLATHLVHYFNEGGNFVDLGYPAIEFAMDLNSLSLDVQVQLLHAVVQSYERKQPVDALSWDFFWRAIMLFMDATCHSDMSPMLVIRALDVVGEFGKRHSMVKMAMLCQYGHFVDAFSLFVASYGPYTTTDNGKWVVASILFHPVWKELSFTTRVLPPDNVINFVWKALDRLERLKHEHALHKYAPLSFDLTTQLYPDYEPVRPHISVDMESAAVKDNGILPPPLPVVLKDLRVDRDPLPPIVPALLPTDLVERDGEEAVGGAISILNIGKTDHRRISVSSSVPVLVYSEMRGAGRALRDHGEEAEEESGLSASVPPLPGPMDVVESDGEEDVVDQRLVGPGLDGYFPMRRVLKKGQSSSSVPTLVPSETGEELNVQQGCGQGASHEEKEKEKEKEG